MDATTATAPVATGAQQPQLRTILLTDLCDSLTLVERLGDTAAAELFREHDRLVLGLQQQWRGRLIDRSDGLLLLFERPIDGLGFALDYVRGLHALGETRQLTLKARAGLHVGEVLTWRNSDEAVSVGAKPLEVEGLAKPTAARLMATARPGQILLSAVAEPLAHRSARELGERGQNLLWKSYGRWRFKGVPDPQEIFEVGEPGLAPLRAPPNSPKAWRDTPLWRRPLALLAEAAAIAVIGVGVWFMTRPQPAIAFAERDWVVVADLRNLTGNRGYDDALETALRIGLEQSRYVNVIADARVERTLQQMGLDPARAVLDRTVASEVAVRDGARAVLLPTVANVGNQVRVSIEVVDPNTQATVFAESAAGRGAESAIGSIGDVSDALRARLGEAMASVQKGSVPLEQATTTNLDALRAYSIAQRAYATQDLKSAEQQFQQALVLDAHFAMARIGLARVAYARTDEATARAQLDLALGDRQRLTDREQLYAGAQRALIGLDRDAIERWQALSTLYPDFHVAAFNTANLMRFANRYDAMRDYSDRAAVSKAITRPPALHYRGIAEAALGRFDDAQRSFELARAERFPPVFVEPALLAAARGQHRQAAAMVAAVDGLPPAVALERRMAAMAVVADAGQWPEAQRMAQELAAATREPRQAFEWAARAGALAVQQRGDDAKALRAAVAQLIEQAATAMPRASGRTREAVAAAALYAGYLAAGLGDVALARQSLATAQPAITPSPAKSLANLAAIVEARLALRAGKPEAAARLLAPYRGADALAMTQRWLREANGETAAIGTPMTPQARARAFAEWAAERPPVLEALLVPRASARK